MTDKSDAQEAIKQGLDDLKKSKSTPVAYEDVVGLSPFQIRIRVDRLSAQINGADRDMWGWAITDRGSGFDIRQTAAEKTAQLNGLSRTEADLAARKAAASWYRDRLKLVAGKRRMRKDER